MGVVFFTKFLGHAKSEIPRTHHWTFANTTTPIYISGQCPTVYSIHCGLLYGLNIHKSHITHRCHSLMMCCLTSKILIYYLQKKKQFLRCLFLGGKRRSTILSSLTGRLYAYRRSLGTSEKSSQSSSICSNEAGSTLN